ncbi:4-hydroxy-tetrahydrodipicolinate reductase [Aureimonas leprariae]|uniref:4-hydroxy-tetrahydrodipicolinate reductase n=1 Tax=Plantimonas leprariae TaxID=2615207 RepID=A0A7V7PM66_9HYPH|nr:4-hydroxy-tetrahydrodipicolinate reductase [Aureimonas leprariae]KAB0677793.1 4-hydroxy-tetrahydrodipicolinate reductase [Aureimonas leprariae]
MTDQPMRIAVVGAAGRMGRTLVRLVGEHPGLALHAGLEREGSDALGRDAGDLAGAGRLGVAVTSDIAAALDGADGVVDFSTPATSRALAVATAERGLVHVIGTTGLVPDDEAAIRAAGTRARIVKSGNMSLGVNLLALLVEQAARALGPEAFDVEILEMHHKHKVDAPSGTALLLGRAAAAGRGVDLEAASVRVRDGLTGARSSGAIGFASLRGGSVVGDHQVILAGEGERIELNHRAEDRTVFARGALAAALWARGQSPGLYSMRDVLGL